MSRERTDHAYFQSLDVPDVEMCVTRKVKAARKVFGCVNCPDPILPGQPYLRTAYVEDGRFGVACSHIGMCPRDAVEAERQFEEDQRLFSGGMS